MGGRCPIGRTLNLHPVLDYTESMAIMLFPSFPGTEEFEKTGTHCAVLFKDPNYKGESRIVLPKEDSGYPGSEWDGVVSSIMVRQGCRFTGYDYNKRVADDWSSITWTTNAPSLKDPYNNDISSWKCFC